MRVKLVSALIILTLLVGMLAMSGTLSADNVPEGPQDNPSTPLAGSSPGAAAPVLAAPNDRAALQEPAGPRSDDPSAFPTVAAERSIQQNPVLIFQDQLPWGSDAIQAILSGAGIGYDVMLSDEIPFVDLRPYELVIIPSVQPDGFYTTLNAHIGRLEDYVVRGGKLWMSGCTYAGAIPLIPGGVVTTYAPDSYNVITEPLHPWVGGVPNPMYGSSASHNRLSNLLPGTVIVATTQTDPLPTLIEYNLGAGHVAVTGQTLEFAWAYGQDGAPILRQSLLYMFHFHKPWILELTTFDTTQSVRRALSELGYSYYTHVAYDWTGIDFSPYDTVIISMDGGSPTQASVRKIRTDVIDRGKRAFFIGGSSNSDFVLGVNQYLVQSNITVFSWAISSTPHWTLVDAGHPLAIGLPAVYNFVTPQASYYQLRVTDPLVKVIGVNGDGHPALFFKRAPFPVVPGSAQQTGDLVWFINSAASDYWLNAADFSMLKQIIANGIQYVSPRRFLPLVVRSPWDRYYEPNDDAPHAYGPLSSAINYLAYPNDTEDYYYFTLTSAKTVDIVVSNFVPTGGDLLLYNEALGLIDYVGYAAPVMRLDDQALSAGKYYVRVRATAGLSTSKLYTLRVTY